MVNTGTAKFVGVVMAIGIIAVAGTNAAFAQQQCGEQPYVYNVGCATLGTAQLYAAVLVAGIAAFAVACGASGIRHRVVQ